MKIGILTFHRAYNYGAVLQAYGLFTFVKKQKFTVEFIDYWPKYHSSRYQIFSLFYIFSQNTLSKKIRAFLFSVFLLIFKFKIFKKRVDKFDYFIYHYLNFYRKNLEKPLTANSYYDAIIYGSDQIWRYDDFLGYNYPNKWLTGLDEVYLGGSLSNVTNKKPKRIAYAGSMGDWFVPNMHDFMNILRNRFDFISVRENWLHIFLTKSDLRNQLVLDPIFLLTKKEWISIAIKSSFRNTIRKGKYILFYNLKSYLSRDSRKNRIFLKKLALICNLDFYEIWSVHPFKRGWCNLEEIGPIDFIYLIQNAHTVFTNSFHGVAFSILFEKSFFALAAHNNWRILSILETLDLQSRSMNHAELCENEFKKARILFKEKQRKKLQELIKSSKWFLIKSLFF